MNVEITRLPNGLTVATDPMPQLESASLGVWVNCGARHETERQMGVSHMLEHMAFKGTERRTARGIAEEIEAVGGALNAYTSREQTAFHARVLKADVPLAVDILADILTHPVFDPGEIERERQVVLQEIGQARDTPDDIVFDHLQSAVYPGQPMGWPILGNEETVASFVRDDLETYMKANYRAGGMALIASGAVEHAAMVELAMDHFGDLGRGAAPRSEPARYVGTEIRASEELEQVHVAYAFPGIASGDDELFAAQVYVTALGGGMSSRLFQNIRERQGLAYAVFSELTPYSDAGLLTVYAGTALEKTEKVIGLVAQEFSNLKREPVTEEELRRAKDHLKGSLMLSLESTGARMSNLARQEMYFGRFFTLDEILDSIESVTRESLQDLAREFFQPEQAAATVVGNLNGFELRREQLAC